MNTERSPQEGGQTELEAYELNDRQQMLQLISRNMDVLRHETLLGTKLDPSILRDLEDEYRKLLGGLDRKANAASRRPFIDRSVRR